MLHLCIACLREVRPRQEAVECDWCQKWQHRTCDTGISRSVYREAVRCGEEITFVCRTCLDKENVFEIANEDNFNPPQLDITAPVEEHVPQINRPPTLEISVLQALLRKLDQVEVEGVVLDYELAAWQAVRDCIPTAEVKGCAFHWSQAVFRHVQQVGLAETYRKRLGLHNFIRMILSLLFLPAAHIRKTFESLLTRATTAATLELMTYMRRQWLENTTFKPEDWSVFKQTVRTKNDVEGWHHRINTKAVTNSLAFYKLVPLLRREAKLVKVAVESGDLDRGSSARTSRLDKSLTDCWEQYCSGEWKTSRFLQSVGDLYSVRQ